jgi:23S rRNA (adenine2030-N6)-methyltransferase
MLKKKDKPFCVLDAFAGEGLYNLNSKESQKNQEYLYGFDLIRKLLMIPNFAKELLNIAENYQTTDNAFIYPGSPTIINAKLRLQDKAIFIENHPQAYAKLRKYFSKYKQVHIHRRDGLEAINALIPFKEKRGLIFIDPSYEIKEEYKTISDVVQRAYQKFPHGIYMLWYPLLQEARHTILLKELKCICDNIWKHEWKPRSCSLNSMYGSGVMVFNPPWQFETIVQEDLDFLSGL